MTDEDSSMARRKFITAAGAGMAALAGCSTGDSGSGGEPTDTDKPTSEPETGSSGPETGSTGEGGQTSSEGEETTTSDSADVEDIENDYEASFEESLGEYGNWLETGESMLDLPSWAEDGELSRDLEEPLGYRDFVNEFMNPEADSAGTFIEHFLAFSEEVEDGEYSSEDPYRLISHQHRVEELDSQFLGYSDIPVKSSAVEKFLQENVHGVIDYGEGTDEELLEYARQ
jgi:hypothetical protein